MLALPLCNGFGDRCGAQAQQPGTGTPNPTNLHALLNMGCTVSPTTPTCEVPRIAHLPTAQLSLRLTQRMTC